MTATDLPDAFLAAGQDGSQPWIVRALLLDLEKLTCTCIVCQQVRISKLGDRFKETGTPFALPLDLGLVSQLAFDAGVVYGVANSNRDVGRSTMFALDLASGRVTRYSFKDAVEPRVWAIGFGAFV